MRAPLKLLIAVALSCLYLFRCVFLLLFYLLFLAEQLVTAPAPAPYPVKVVVFRMQ